MIFDKPENRGNWEDVLIIFETKTPSKEVGLSQLEQLMSREPRALLGVWTNGSARTGLRRTADGRFEPEPNIALPRPQDELIQPSSERRLAWDDLRPITTRDLMRAFDRLLSHVVATDSKSTRRDEQLDQICNLLLLKLESDRRGKSDPTQAVTFQVWGDDAETGAKIRQEFEDLWRTNTDVFSSPSDRFLQLDDSTIQKACYELGVLKLMDTPIDIISQAFQVFRSASLKSEEGQYFTPQRIIRHAVSLIEIDYSDRVLDPACGTGGFLVECFRQFQERYGNLSASDRRAWAQQHLFGVDKDRVNVKLTKAIMIILGDGAAHTYRGDSLLKHRWADDFPHLVPVLEPDTFTCIVTNPPFGRKLTLSAGDAKQSRIEICLKPEKEGDGLYRFKPNSYNERELGIVFLERCHELLVSGGRLAIILPETYMFSARYLWLQQWLQEHFVLRGIFNVPMEAFQGFCRAKTNLYVMEKR